MSDGNQSDYNSAMDYTVSGRAGQKGGGPWLPAADLLQIRNYLNPPGRHFIGVSAVPDRDGRVLFADYSGPAVVLADLVENSAEVRLKRLANIDRAWVDDRRWVRLFAEPLAGSDAKRAQCAVVRPGSDVRIHVWCTQNTDTDTITRLMFVSGKTFVVDAPIILKGDHRGGKIEAFCVMDDRIYVARNPRDPSRRNASWLDAYDLDGNPVKHDHRCPTANWANYGCQPYGDGQLAFITSRECVDVESGIYVEDKLVVGGITGNGFCLPWGKDGPGLAVQYNAGLGDFGAPCELINVPRHLLT